jgi:hypothetical protein
MSRNPLDRYLNAMEMKEELDHPEKVEVTGRADRLVVPNVVSGNMRRYLVVGLAVAIPVLVFLTFLFFANFKISHR